MHQVVDIITAASLPAKAVFCRCWLSEKVRHLWRNSCSELSECEVSLQICNDPILDLTLDPT